MDTSTAVPIPKTAMSDFAHFISKNSEARLIEELNTISVGINTGYTIGDIDLAFPGGAISIIAAPTSHGKTTALINFSLGVLKNNKKSNVYFFTHEESSAAILLSFLNAWIGEEVAGNNRLFLEQYFREPEKKKLYTHESFTAFNTKKESFFRDLIDTGRLKIHYADITADKLVEAIQFIKQHDQNVGMICIDYMQLLKLTPSARSRQEELKQICLMLNECAIATGLPLVIAAQFNRTVTTEADLSPVQIGEAGDIERIASLIIGIFNRSFNAMCRTGNINRNGYVIPQEHTLYVEVLKGRKIGNGHACVMNFNGNSGVISNISKNSMLKGFDNMQIKDLNNTQIQPAKKPFDSTLIDLMGI